MISVTEALTYLAQSKRNYGTELVPLTNAANRILAQDIFADRDFPPYDRVTMDGIAISSKAYSDGCRSFRIEKIQAAGAPQQQLEDVTACIEVMTGAVLPCGTDAVVPYEDCTISDGMACLSADVIRPYQNIHLKGTDAASGSVLIQKGGRVTATTIGIMASVGMDKIMVQRLPKVAICSSGDELVPITNTPQHHQIRTSNSYMLAGALSDERIAPDLYHLPDDKAAMQKQLEVLLIEYEILLFSGAVSKGKYDFLPEVLGGLGMQTVFHRVAQRPGKPFLFGQFDSGPVLFGFPGNPASTLVCYKIYFEPWLYNSLSYKPKQLSAQLQSTVTFKPSLAYHLLVTLQVNSGVLEATPQAGANSGDMVSLEAADAILTLPADQQVFEAGCTYPLTLLSKFF